MGCQTCSGKASKLPSPVTEYLFSLHIIQFSFISTAKQRRSHYYGTWRKANISHTSVRSKHHLLRNSIHYLLDYFFWILPHPPPNDDDDDDDEEEEEEGEEGGGEEDTEHVVMSVNTHMPAPWSYDMYVKILIRNKSFFEFHGNW